MRVLVVRIGAFGDCLQITPILRHLKSQGNEIFVLTSERGIEVLHNNPNIDKLILHVKDSVPCDKLGEEFDRVKKENCCDKIIDLCESIEVKYVLHPVDPQYNYSKQERFELCNKNHYDVVIEAAGLTDVKHKNPEMFFTDEEEKEFARFKSDILGAKLIVWCLSGSSMHKAFPYTKYVMDKVLREVPGSMFITVGDDICSILEDELKGARIINKCGKWNMRQTAIACKNAAMVIAPETGVLHISGCFDTPKLGLITHTTKECLTKYFVNDYSIEAKVSCAPCFRLIYDAKVQCPIDPISKLPWCAGIGFNPDEIADKIIEVLE